MLTIDTKKTLLYLPLSTPWQVLRAGRKFGAWIRVGLAALSQNFWLKLALRIFHSRWQECSQPIMDQSSTNHIFVLIYINLVHNMCMSDILCEEGVWLVVYCVLGLCLSCFVLYSAVNVDKVNECNRYIIYIKIVFSNNCRSIIIW